MNFKFGSFVLKEEALQTHCFMAALLQALDWPYLNSYHLRNAKGAWEISEYAGPYTLEKWLHQPGYVLSNSLVHSLAKHAALGDCIGRGDRHFENYVMRGKALLPLDLSFLFSAYHEQWVMSYTKSGMGELGCLQLLLNDEQRFFTMFTLFFDVYQQSFSYLQSKQDIFVALIKEHFKDPIQQSQYLSFFRHRVTHPQYLQSQCQSYTSGFQTFLKRFGYKEILAMMVSKDAGVLKLEPLLAMYYQADLNRFSTFFQLDEFDRQYLFPLIDRLAQARNIPIGEILGRYDVLLDGLRRFSF
eukprot:COSAG01_NODE_216_length_21695_cov_83.368772_1_plen_300_part_00